MTARIELRSYTDESPLLEVALDIYARVWPDRDRAAARESFSRYARYEGFLGLVAFVEDEPAGVAYGATSRPGIWWHDKAADGLGASHPALQDAWRLVELAVVDEYRQQGVGSRLHDALLAAHPNARVLICTAVHNSRARGMYERRGWHYVARSFDFPGEPHPYVIMGREMARR